MSEIITNTNFLLDGNRLFIQSENINIFPCSRRGQYSDTNPPLVYDPEARLNTERTNRLHTALNGFKDCFILNNPNDFKAGDTLVFVLAGYYIEVKNFNPQDFADKLKLKDTDDDTVYAHLSLHTGIDLNTPHDNVDYTTEILYRQSNETIDHQYLDVAYTDGNNTKDFFVGVSFVKEPIYSETIDSETKKVTISYNLPIFEYSNDSWNLVQSSLLPKIEHGETKDSIKISGDFTIEHTKDNGEKQTSFKVTKDETILGPTKISELEVTVEDLTVSEGNINVTKGKVTTKELQVDTYAKIKDLDVDANIYTDTVNAIASITAPLVKTNKITSDNTEVIIDKAVNVTGKATLNSDIDVKGNLTVQSGNALLKKTTVEGLTDTGNTTLKNLKVHNTDNTALADVDKITALSATITNLTINDKAIVKELDAENATIDNLSIGTDINLKNGVITANKVIVDGSQVPVIALEQIESAANSAWQLQINNVNVIKK